MAAEKAVLPYFEGCLGEIKIPGIPCWLHFIGFIDHSLQLAAIIRLFI